MKTLIIPCAGKSSRFPNMKPKWLLTHPDGRLMIEKSISGLNLTAFDRVIITIVKEHDLKYDASVILKQAFKNLEKVELCILDQFTQSAAQTIVQTIEHMNVTGAFVVKDCDNFVNVSLPREAINFVAFYDIHKHTEISNLPAKSYIRKNDQEIVIDIAEKEIISNFVCLGVYAFESVELFRSAYEELSLLNLKEELYLSRLISYLVNFKNVVFTAIEADGYEDWGTVREWKKIQKRSATYFVDLDGVLLINRGKYGAKNWDNSQVELSENLMVLKKLYDSGAQIVITTSRPNAYRQTIVDLLHAHGILAHEIVMGLNHSPRVIINDFAVTNAYPSCLAINLKRDTSLVDYLDVDFL